MQKSMRWALTLTSAVGVKGAAIEPKTGDLIIGYIVAPEGVLSDFKKKIIDIKNTNNILSKENPNKFQVLLTSFSLLILTKNSSSLGRSKKNSNFFIYFPFVVM